MSVPFGQGGGSFGPPSAPLPTVGVEPPRPPSTRGRAIAIVVAVVFGVATIGLVGVALARRGDVDDRNATIEERRDDNDRLDDRVSDLEDDQAAAEEELATSNSLIDSLTDDLADATADLEAAEADLETARSHLSELEAAATSTTTTSLPPATTLPPDPTATLPPDMTMPSLPPELSATFNDGAIDESELVLLNGYVESLPDMTLEQAQDIADHLCASTTQTELGSALDYALVTYFPGGDVVDVATLASAVGVSACNDALRALIAAG